MDFAAVNLGCKVNHVELEDFASRLLARGCRLVKPEAADVILINTCTVTGEAERKTRKAVNRALAANGHARVILTGCSVAIDPEGYMALSPRISVVSKADMPAYLETLADGEPASGHEAMVSASTKGEGPSLFRTRTGVRIQDGCDNACTYCIIHTARGPARSFPREQILRQTEDLLRSGVKEVVLTGINLGTYRDERGGLPGLLFELLELDETLGGGARFRLSSIEPPDVTAELIEVMAQAEGRICRHLHMPLQSGSDHVLREMDRHYTAAEFLATVEALRAAMSGMSLSTDVIVGFPGETDADFAATCGVSRQAAFSKIHVFPYSMRAGTPAAARTDQVPVAVKQERARILRLLSDELRAADYARRIGSVEAVLVEGKGFGMTESYHKVPVPADAPAGSLLELELAVVE